MCVLCRRPLQVWGPGRGQREDEPACIFQGAPLQARRKLHEHHAVWPAFTHHRAQTQPHSWRSLWQDLREDRVRPYCNLCSDGASAHCSTNWIEVYLLLHHYPSLCCRRYVKHSQSPNSESRASASATFASCSQAPECSTSSSLNASLGGCGSPLSDGASRSASSSNGSNHSGTCNETNGLYDGKLPIWIC